MVYVGATFGRYANLLIELSKVGRYQMSMKWAAELHGRGREQARLFHSNCNSCPLADHASFCGAVFLCVSGPMVGNFLLCVAQLQ